MLTVYVQEGTRLKGAAAAPDALPAAPVWIDLLNATEEETAGVEAALGLDLPTRAVMEEIEASSRIYQTGEARVMTAIVLARNEAGRVEAAPVTFVLAGETLATLRHTEPQPFRSFAKLAAERSMGVASGEAALVGLLEAIVDRVADVLEGVAADVEALTQETFEREGSRPSKPSRFHEILKKIGQKGDLNGKARESLVSLGRIVAHLAEPAENEKRPRDLRNRIKTLGRDVSSLSDHASFVSNKVNFLLDATLGMVNIEQNAIIKIFSVAAVAFLPPTLIASIYGMNFKVMPELDWPYGYPLAIGAMIASAILPYLYFKRRGWL